MKILICTATFDIVDNGTIHFPNFLLKINELYPQHEVSVLTEDIQNLPNKSYQNVYSVTVNYPRPVHALQMFLRNITYWCAVKALHKIKFFDIIIFNAGITGLWTRWQLPNTVKMYGFIFDDNGIIVEKTNQATWRKKIYKYLENFLLEQTLIRQANMTILCPSHYLANLIIKTYHSDATKIKCFHQAIDVSMIPYKQPSKIESSVKILFVKWDFRRGGLLVLGQALGQLSQYQFELSVLGPSPHDFKGIYTFFNKFPNIKLHLEGIVSQNVFFEQLAQHDIFCIPAKAESLGLANAQALASGISVVSTNAGGIPEVMNGDENGWLALPNDINSLEKALKSCIEAPMPERIQKSLNGRIWVERHFDYKPMLKKFITLVERNLHY